MTATCSLDITIVRNRSRSSPGVRRFYVGRPTALGSLFPVNEWGRIEAVRLNRECLELVLQDPDLEQLVVSGRSITLAPERARKMVRQFVRILKVALVDPIELGCSCVDDRGLPAPDQALRRQTLPCHADDVKECLEAWQSFAGVVQMMAA